MTNVEKVQSLLAAQLAPEEVGQWHALAMKLAVLVDYYESIGRAPESNWDRDFRAAIGQMCFASEGRETYDAHQLAVAAWVADEMERVRRERRERLPHE